MATSARELVGWTEQRWTAVEEAAKKALARTAKCRRVIPIGAEQIGAKTVVIPTIESGGPIAYGPETVTSPIQIFVTAALNDQIADDEAAVCRLVEFAAAQLGLLEDKEVIQSISPVPATTNRPAALPQGSGVRIRIPGLPRASLKKNKTVARQTAIRAAGVAPTANEIVAAVRTAQGKLEAAGRPGPCGLLLHSHLFATLLDVAPGGTPYLQQVEQFIDSNEIAGTSALDGGNDGPKEGKKSNAGDQESKVTDQESKVTDRESKVDDRVCGILFRLEPPAVELVQTARPTVTVLGRENGQTGLQVEEDLVIRILDEDAIGHIVY
jgi:encapsulating protein for peroxidase